MNLAGLKQMLRRRTGQDKRISVIAATTSEVEFSDLAREVEAGRGLIVAAKGKENGKVLVLWRADLEDLMEKLTPIATA
jgi:hypothetical protein